MMTQFIDAYMRHQGEMSEEFFDNRYIFNHMYYTYDAFSILLWHPTLNITETVVMDIVLISV